MNTGVGKASYAKLAYTSSWKDLYQAAIWESDLNRLPERIAEAESALVTRMRDLWYASGDKFEEEDSLEDAMCILQALRGSLERRASGIQAGSTSARVA
jgi:hypothetical protein